MNYKYEDPNWVDGNKNEENPETKTIIADFEKGADAKIEEKVAEMEKEGKSQEVIDVFLNMASQAKKIILEIMEASNLEKGLLMGLVGLFGSFLVPIGMITEQMGLDDGALIVSGIALLCIGVAGALAYFSQVEA